MKENCTQKKTKIDVLYNSSNSLIWPSYNELKKKRESFEDEIEELLENKSAILNIEERRITDSICSTIDQIKEMPILYLTAKNPYQKAELLKNIVRKIKMAGDQLNFIWKEPYSFLMKSNVIELKNYLEVKEIDQNAQGEPVFRTGELMRANQESIRTLINDIKLNFRLWLMAS